MTFRVVFAPEAEAELGRLADYIEDRTGSIAVAEGYVLRLVDHCLALAHFPERGTRRDDIRPGLRTMGFERQATIAFAIEEDRVTILRVLYAGRQFGAGS